MLSCGGPGTRMPAWPGGPYWPSGCPSRPGGRPLGGPCPDDSSGRSAEMLSVRSKLSLMMFLQYFVWGSWAGRRAGTWARRCTLTVAASAPSIPLRQSAPFSRRCSSGTSPIACWRPRGFWRFCISSAGGLLLWASQQTEFKPLLFTMIAYAPCYMPTLALTNSISFQNIEDPEKDFPRIRVFGTVGSIVAGLIVGILLGGVSNTFFYMAGGSSILLGLFCLTLPHTPPRGGGGGDVLGLGCSDCSKSHRSWSSRCARS